MIPELNQLTGIDISVFLLLIGVILLYFGKVIGDTKVEKYDKLGYYIEGLFFTSMYVIPLVVAYYVGLSLSPPYWSVLLLQIVIMSLLSYNLIANEFLRKHGLVGKLRDNIQEKLNKMKSQSGILGHFLKDKDSEIYTKIVVWTYYKVPIKIFGSRLAFFISSVIAIKSVIYFYNFGNMIFFVVSFILTFFILTMVAAAYGYKEAYYPPAKIYLDDGQTIDGKILKIGDFVYLLKGDKKFFVNSSKIKYVEENLFKEKESD